LKRRLMRTCIFFSMAPLRARTGAIFRRREGAQSKRHDLPLIDVSPLTRSASFAAGCSVCGRCSTS
jgi:hypothetical protein